MEPLIADDDAFTPVVREAAPANIVIKVESFSSLSFFGALESRSFLAGYFDWKVTIYTGGRLHGDNEYIPVYLSIVHGDIMPEHWAANAVFTFILYNHKMRNYHCFRGKARWFNAKMPNYGFSKLISKKVFTDPCNGYLVDDCCVLGAEVSVSRCKLVDFLGEAQHPYCHRDWAISRFSRIGDIWTSEIFSCGTHQWRIKLYPKGIGSEKGQSVSIYLESIDCRSFGPADELKACFSITCKSIYSDVPIHTLKCSHRFARGEPEKGFGNFMGIADFRNSFLDADDCYLGVTMFNEPLIQKEEAEVIVIEDGSYPLLN